MTISYYPSEEKYLGLSTDDKTSISSQEGAKIYLVDIKKTQICHSGAWYDYSEQTSITGSLPNQTLVEQLTEADVVLGVLTFSANIVCIEIYNTDATNSGTFTVNGIDIVVPATKSFMSPIGGTTSATVSITGATTYIVSRYV